MIFFTRKTSFLKEESAALFKSPYNVSVRDFIYYGEKDKDGWIFWKPQVKEEKDSFENLSKLLNCELHKDFIDYANSFWFLDLSGFFHRELVEMIAIEPRKDGSLFEQTIIHYIEGYELPNKYIPIGTLEEIDLIMLDNEKGEVVCFYYYTKEVVLLSGSLVEFISELEIILEN